MPEQLSKNNDVSKVMVNFFKKKKFQKNFSRQISGKISDFQGNSIQSG